MQVHDVAAPIGRRYGVRTWGKAIMPRVQGPGEKGEGGGGTAAWEGSSDRRLVLGTKRGWGMYLGLAGAAAALCWHSLGAAAPNTVQKGNRGRGACMSHFLLLKGSRARLFFPAAPPHPDNIFSSEYLLNKSVVLRVS